MDDTNNSQKEDTPHSERNKKSDLKHSSNKKPESKLDNTKNDKDMEVHVKHKEHKGFNYKHFLYEFLIIFLAVSVSFFVENIRERYIEHHKEMQYVKSLINDIKLDTAQLTSIINKNLNQLKGIDTLLKELEKPNSPKVVYYLYRYTLKYLTTLSLYSHTDRTITQLKNAGGLRLIQSKAASDSIVTFDGSVFNVELNGEYCLKIFYDLTQHQKELLDLKVVRTNSLNESLANPNLKLLNSDSKRIDLYYNETFYFVSTLGSYKEILIALKKQATQLLVTLNEEYDLE